MLNHKFISDIIYIHVVFAQLTYLCLNVLNVYRCELLFPISEDLNKNNIRLYKLEGRNVFDKKINRASCITSVETKVAKKK